MSVCARCPKALGRSCCEVAQDEKLATLTHVDVERIAAARGLQPSAFIEEDMLDAEVAHDYELHRPLYAGYFRTRPVRLTLARRGGACVFHDARSGCTLDEATRPTACLLYPFEPWPGGEVTLLVDRHGSLDQAASEGGCLGVEEAESMDALMAAFGMTPAKVEALGERLRAEVSMHARARPPDREGGVPPRRRLRYNE